MSQITIMISCEDADDAREVLDMLENRSEPTSNTSTKAPEYDLNNPPTDEEGFPFDPELHVAPDNFKADGNFRAKRGKSEEEKAARQAWKAAGGPNTGEAAQPPAAPPTPAPGLPGLPGSSAKTEVPPPAEVGLNEVLSKAQNLIDSGRIDSTKITEIYQEASGVTIDKCMDVFEVDAAARAKLWTLLEAHA